jgi:hypothetical protein
MHETLTETWQQAVPKPPNNHFPWKRYLGTSLRQFAYERASWGWKQEAVRIEVLYILNSKGVPDTPHLKRCLCIGVSAGFTEYNSISKGESMEEKIEEPQDAEGFTAETERIEWTDLGTGEKKESRYFKPETDKRYKLIFFHAEPFIDHRYGKPQKKVRTVIQSINGEPVNQLTWETGSWTILNGIRKVVEEGRLSRTEFLLKRIEDSGKVKYIFEELGETSPSPSSNIEAPI